MTAAAIFAKSAQVVLDHLGIPVVYTPRGGGAPITIQALVSSVMQNQPSGLGSETWGQHVSVEFRLSDLAVEPASGDTVNDGINTYILVAPLENNGILTKWVVS
jgi:hypothetical protein